MSDYYDLNAHTSEEREQEATNWVTLANALMDEFEAGVSAFPPVHLPVSDCWLVDDAYVPAADWPAPSPADRSRRWPYGPLLRGPREFRTPSEQTRRTTDGIYR